MQAEYTGKIDKNRLIATTPGSLKANSYWECTARIVSNRTRLHTFPSDLAKAQVAYDSNIWELYVTV